MKASEAAERMVELENHGEDWNLEQFLTWLLLLDDEPEAAGEIFQTEIRRAGQLAEGHYARVTGNLTVMNPMAILVIGFQQGATFAAAAFGRTPRQQEGR